MSESMRAVEVAEPGASFELVEREIPEPSGTEVRVEVEACGVCHSDAYAKEGGYPGLSYPRIPGHEIVGRVDAVGEDVELWEEGDRVGAGWHGGHCFTCEACRRGEFQQCENADIHGVTVDGGYAEYAAVNAEALARVPDELDATDAAPLLCAGITTYNALRHTDARPGDLVAVQGIGGLGHLGVQYARQAGFETVAISRGTDKEEYARELGADHFIDAKADDPAEELQKLGGAKVVLATAPNADAISSVVPGLGTDGEVVVVGVPGEPIDVSGAALVGSRGAVRGWASGHARESQDTLEFSALRDITPEVETFDLADADEAYERMMENEVRFRAVLEP
ncbi:alcohol dehydrogenase [Haladaptatus paucihalophilus]|uniref:NADPH2:quinone reductase n=2 Tax=Haladaptatus paucihalophilus DX253 TaxID=797209 RepID=A0A1M6X246_HALPU|nr:alcohol dehydrogenase [Haladaptatus paucihalophilus]SHL00003.1 NADPH2:quinone reductase [Haladaptatus paucihalophilus DX253]